MKVRRVSISHFRGVKDGCVRLDAHSLLVGGNAVGKSTVCEALDLVLGLERLYRRPVIDEYDFHTADYLLSADAGEDPRRWPEVRIEVVLTELSEPARRRFHGHLRPWSPETEDFATSVADGAVDLVDGEWCLPVTFIGRFNPADDDFEGETFFAHPQRPEGDDDPDRLGSGLTTFRREDKRYCGFLYLRPNRTGSRALSFGRGSLIDTIVRLESDRAEVEQTDSLWTSAVDALSAVDLTGTTPGFDRIRNQVYSRAQQFLSMPPDDTTVGVRPSDLTRQHLREVLRMFIATEPGTYAVPFSRLSTGALNVIVFALLTYIADLRDPGSVIFAMEEPEIALPPHTQRRLVDFVTETMGQAIVTSHSPYVIERFEPGQIVVLRRDASGTLTSGRIDLGDVKPRKYREQQRQFAEAVLARAVLVVEGATEVAACLAVADALNADPATDYQHPDVAGVSVFDAGGDTRVPLYAPIFADLGKTVFGLHDTPAEPLTSHQQAMTQRFANNPDSGYTGIENLLVNEIPPTTLRKFLNTVKARSDYPQQCGSLPDLASDKDAAELARDVLRARKGPESFAPILIAECSRHELPPTLVNILLDIHAHIAGNPNDGEPDPGSEDAELT